jgi:hypothetical protein
VLLLVVLLLVAVVVALFLLVGLTSALPVTVMLLVMAENQGELQVWWLRSSPVSLLQVTRALKQPQVPPVTR